MTVKIYDTKVLEKTGLQEAGKDDEGNQLYMGTHVQWVKASDLQHEVDEEHEREIDEMILERKSA